MAEANKTRGTQLIRTDDSIPGVVTFYDRRQTNVVLARIGSINVFQMLETAGLDPADVPAHIVRAAIHGYTQNMLDSSNKLEGDDRVAYIRKTCMIVTEGGWASAPVDETKARENAIAALMKLGFSREKAEAAVSAG